MVTSTIAPKLIGSMAASHELSSPSESTSFRVVRKDLALPNELLHKIITWALSGCVHSICTSSEDTIWEKKIMETFHQVSPAFKAISSEIAARAFDLGKDVRNNDASLLHSLGEIFSYLGLLGARFRHPTDWGGVSFQTIDCSASSFVFAYALFLSCITLRRNACRSPRDVFESTHKVVLSALVQSTALCERVRPAEMTSLLMRSVAEEYSMAVNGLAVVEGFGQLSVHINSFTILQPHVDKDGTGPIKGVKSLMSTALAKVEGAFPRYDGILLSRGTRLDARLHELPGVVQPLRRMASLTFDDGDEYNLKRRIKLLVDQWSIWCPFLNKDSASHHNSLSSSAP